MSNIQKVFFLPLDIWLEVVGEISGKLFEPTISFPVKKVFEPNHAWLANMEVLRTYVSLI